MGFFDAISRGWGITKASLKLVSQDPEMLVLPVFSGLVFLFILLLLITPIAFFGRADNTYLWIALAIMYFVSYFTLYFTQAMIIEMARLRFSGGNPKLADGFKAAASNLTAIVVLALIGAVIAVLTSVLREKSDKAGSAAGGIIASLIGASWTVITYFSLPVILYERKNALESFPRSMDLVSKSWGTGVSAHMSLIVLFIPAALALVLAFVVPGLLLAFFVLAALLFLGAILVQSVVKGILSEALYLYATTGKTPAEFGDAVKGFYSK